MLYRAWVDCPLSPGLGGWESPGEHPKKTQKNPLRLMGRKGVILKVRCSLSDVDIGFKWWKSLKRTSGRWASATRLFVNVDSASAVQSSEFFWGVNRTSKLLGDKCVFTKLFLIEVKRTVLFLEIWQKFPFRKKSGIGPAFNPDKNLSFGCSHFSAEAH